MKKILHCFSRLRYLSIRRVLIVVLPLWCIWGLIDVNNWRKDPLRDANNFTPYQDSAGKVVRLGDEKNMPFRVSGMTMSDFVAEQNTYIPEKYETALRHFPTVSDCLQTSEWEKIQPDLTNIDWNKIDNNEEAEVCLFRIASSYQDSPQAMKAWFETLFPHVESYVMIGEYPEMHSAKMFEMVSVISGWEVKTKNQPMLIYRTLLDKWVSGLLVWGTHLTVQYVNNNVFGTGVSDTIE